MSWTDIVNEKRWQWVSFDVSLVSKKRDIFPIEKALYKCVCVYSGFTIMWVVKRNGRRWLHSFSSSNSFGCTLFYRPLFLCRYQCSYSNSLTLCRWWQITNRVGVEGQVREGHRRHSHCLILHTFGDVFLAWLISSIVVNSLVWFVGLAWNGSFCWRTVDGGCVFLPTLSLLVSPNFLYHS